MKRRRLLIDAGNSSLKWAVVEGDQWRAQGRCNYADADAAALQAQLTHDMDCFIASVAQPANAQWLAALLAEAAIVPAWLRSTTEFAGLKNTYLEPQQLGVDRWMGLIAAHERCRGPVLVVSVGTAMTVDALAADGVFLGGLIVPGVTLMRRALRQGTAQVGEAAGHWQPFPRATSDAVQSGIVAALCGAIALQHRHLAEIAGSLPHCLLTGGDADLILPHLTVPAERVPALVLEGIDCVARKEAS